MKTVRLKVNEAFITLGQLLKLEGIIQTGGEAKYFLSSTEVYVNGDHEMRRGKKLRDGDRIRVPGMGEFVISRS